MMVKKMGRPTLYTEELAKIICLRIAEGASLRAVCKGEGMPSRQTIFNWLFDYPDFLDHYTRARECQADSLMEELLEIADTTTPELVNVAKLRLDARKFFITKVAPKRFGDKITQEVTGADGGAIKTQHSNDLDFSRMTDEELKEIIRLTEKAQVLN